MKILAVDNQPVMLKFYEHMMKKHNHELITAEDGLSALEVLKNYVPDVVLLDLVMPNIDGKRICRIIRKNPDLKDACVIVISAVAAEEGMDYKEFGANACIAKGPLDKMESNIVETMQGFLDRPDTDVIDDGIKGIEDVSQRAITKELINWTRHLNIILNNMSEGILELSPAGVIIYANPTAVSLIGRPEEELLGKHFAEIFSSGDQEIVREYLQHQAIRKPRTLTEASVQLNGHFILLNLLPVQGEYGNTIVAILKDVTEKRQIEAQLQHAMKMEAIGTLAGGIAHDFNNLLMGIQGNVSVLLLDVNISHPHYEYLQRIGKIVKSGAKLTEQLLGYARKVEFEVKPVDVNRLITETSEIFSRTKKEITIDRDLVEDLYPVEADRHRLEQVLLNLYINAWQAMTDGGTLSIETRNVTHKRIKAKFYKPAPGKYVMICIKDTGIGIEKHILKNIFDPFFTTKEIGRGSGLGLASAYGIIKSHNGYIEVESRKGKGTSFFIFMPASDKTIVKEEDEYDQPAAFHERILLVDDEQIIIEAGGKMLQILGYDVIAASSGKQALQLFEEQMDEIDLVILDLIMPEMRGDEVYRNIKKMNPEARVMISSGYSMNGLPKELKLSKCDGFIKKPYDIRELFFKTREVLDCKKYPRGHNSESYHQTD
ncbi:hypothetical protein D3OALGA1CA_2675 [Olavius algarvensis associated proteobacterium Delta 3]|nr:hypothetical protein D3OALGB2SA_2625 [Olavius algarvensis associated proteobacterium Delta 3]CAB5122631.1 hypothetical protein D3OALGA1CA_2675 [Olavius algarvensis associated proteobacterium Delta 3]